MARTSTVYLLHFQPVYAVPTAAGWTKTAGHYLGSTRGDPYDRLHAHVRGQGSPLVRAAVLAGCTVYIVRTWPGGRDLERRLKRQRHHARFCPECAGTGAGGELDPHLTAPTTKGDAQHGDQ